MAEWTKLVRQFLSNLGGDAPLSSDSVDFESQLWYRVLRHARSSGELTAAIRFLAVLDSSLERLHIFDDSGAVTGNNISHATKLGIFIKWLKEHRDLNADVRLEEASHQRFSLNEEGSCTSMILCACELCAYVIQRNSCRKLASAVKEAGAEALPAGICYEKMRRKVLTIWCIPLQSCRDLRRRAKRLGFKSCFDGAEKKLHFSIGDVAIAALQFYKELPLDEDERRDPVFRLEPGSLEPAGLSDDGEGMFSRDLPPLRWCVSRQRWNLPPLQYAYAGPGAMRSDEISKLRRVSLTPKRTRSSTNSWVRQQLWKTLEASRWSVTSKELFERPAAEVA